MPESKNPPGAAGDSDWTPLDVRGVSVDDRGAPRLTFETLPLTEGESRRIEAFLERHALSRDTALASAWAVLLARACRESDVVFPVLRDLGPSATATAGALRTSVPEDGSTLAWLSELQASIETSPSAPLGESRRLESVLDLRTDTAEPGPYTGAALRIRATGTAELRLEAHFDAGCIEPVLATRLLRCLRTLLVGLLVDVQPTRTPRELPLLRPEERRQVLEQWNETARDFGRDLCIHRLFEEQARRSPDAVAVRLGDETLSFGELDRHATRLAHRLVRQGAACGERVGIFGERSLEVIVAFVAVCKAGAAYVPLDPDEPAQRLAFLLEDAGISTLLTQSKFRERVPGEIPRVHCLDDDAALLEEPPDEPLVRDVGPDSLAYVIYTSGSTGKPKGALNLHSGIANRILWMQERYRLTEDDRVLQKTPFSFDVSGWEIWLPLISGATMVLARPQGHRDSAYLTALIAEREITHIHFVPSMLRIFLEDPAVERCTSLRQVIASGEELTSELQNRFHAQLEAPLDNLYGPTEAAIDVSYWRCDRQQREGIVPIGHPVANTRLYILDANLDPLPIGFAGELCIAGVQVGAGYHRRPELTAERFLPDPFAGEVGQGDTQAAESRLYRTGDLARYREDGAIEFLGRIDHQVKLRGFRIELGEIDTTLEAVPSVRAAVTTVHDFGDGDQRLVAYVVRASNATAGAEPEWFEALRTHAAGCLPTYMVPSEFIVLPELPLTSSGKVNRRALPPPHLGRPESTSVEERDDDDLENWLEGLWRQLLRTDRVGRDDRFFELGGSSLLAARLINRVQERLGEQVFIVALFEAPTVASFSRYLAGRYPEAIAREFSTWPTAVAPALVERRIDEADVDRLQDLIPGSAAPVASVHEKNPSAVFILSTHRSGTTLLRAMLAGHPELFAAPELQLLGFSSMAARRDAFQGKAALWAEGALRAIMELDGVDADRARRIVADLEDRDAGTQELFALLQERAAPRRLVDKSPSYALDPAALERAEAYFDDVRFIHLVRHPLAMVRSAEDFRMEQVWMVDEHGWSPRQLAELVWCLSHRNILRFLDGVPSSRWTRLRFEDMVQQPRESMEGLCQGIGLSFDESLLRPYEGKERKMLDGIHPESMPMGDTRFHGYDGIDAAVADKWLNDDADDTLAECTWRLAERLGYARPSTKKREAPTRAGDALTRTPDRGRSALQAQRRRRDRRRKT